MAQMNKENWIYIIQKMRERNSSIYLGDDNASATVQSMIEVLIPHECKKYHGDGKFSKLYNYISDVYEFAEIALQAYSHGKSGGPEMQALILGIKECLELLKLNAEIIKRG